MCLCLGRVTSSPFPAPVTPLVRGCGAAWEGPETTLHLQLQGREGVPPLGDSWELGFREVRPGVEVGSGSKDSWVVVGALGQCSARAIGRLTVAGCDRR